MTQSTERYGSPKGEKEDGRCVVVKLDRQLARVRFSSLRSGKVTAPPLAGLLLAPVDAQHGRLTAFSAGVVWLPSSSSIDYGVYRLTFNGLTCHGGPLFAAVFFWLCS